MNFHSLLLSRRLQRGQTLIETLITLFFIGIYVIALAKFQNYLSYDNILAQQKSEATILAVKQIEKLRDYQVLNTTSGYVAYQDIASGTGTTTGANTTYNLSWTVTAFTNPTYKNIDVTVTWTDPYNNSSSVRFTTDVGGVDPNNAIIVMM